ncbi:MAG: hypothetical protein HY699_05495 [Deltaproteobacteria bacterium]|nr:hypothetical protein [Deltaproteobacteria bacterium]
MRRTLGIVAVTAAALVLLELRLGTPLFRWLQPEILTPAEGALVSAPLLVRWDGPPRLALSLVANGSPARDLGIHPSPFELTSQDLAAPGPYRLRAHAPILGGFGGLIQAERRFAVAAPAPPPPRRPATEPRAAQPTPVAEESEDEEQQAESVALYEENAALRQENATLLQELERLVQENDDTTSQAAVERQQRAQLAQENRALSEQLSVLQWRLNAALTCTVWGYYAYPRPQTIPPTRRVVTVSDTRGEVFRAEPECETVRRADPAAASPCFCVGAPWGS